MTSTLDYRQRKQVPPSPTPATVDIDQSYRRALGTWLAVQTHPVPLLPWGFQCTSHKRPSMVPATATLAEPSGTSAANAVTTELHPSMEPITTCEHKAQN